VGDPAEINRQPIDALIEAGFIPVIAPLGLSESGDTYNINADTFEGAIAGAMKADRLLLLTDVPGVLDENKNLIARLSVEEVRALIARGVISGGMIPKVETCIEATELGVGGVVILDGKVPNAVLLELFTQHGAGTLIG
jgi:acetylglutamate kinase